MGLFAVCPQCGKKKVSFLFSDSGICLSCAKENVRQEEQETEKKHEADLSNASQYYEKLVNLWHTTGELRSFSGDSLEQAQNAVKNCDSLIEMLLQLPDVPAIREVISQHCSYIGPDGCSSNDFGNLPVERVGTDGFNVNFDSILERTKVYRRTAEKSISSTLDFQAKMEQIHRVNIVPDLTAIPQAPTDSYMMVKTTNLTERTPASRFGVFFVVDVETTGLHPLSDEIVQITALRFMNFEPVDTFTTYIKPRNGLKSKAQAINGITEDDVGDAPYIEQVIRQFDNFLTQDYAKENPPIIGHNISFDYQFLRANGAMSLLANRKIYDTLEQSRRVYSYLHSYKLDDLTKKVLGVMRTDAHDSLSDALATGLLFTRLCRMRRP